LFKNTVYLGSVSIIIYYADLFYILFNFLLFVSNCEDISLVNMFELFLYIFIDVAF
jgi:hypothetical protein